MTAFRKTAVWLALLNSIVLPLLAHVSIDSIFRDGMVLQRDAAIHLWGGASADEKILTLQFGIIQKKITARSGKWEISLPALPAGGPYTVSITGKTTATVKDILIGDVWICAGQSNMRFRVQQSTDVAMALLQAQNPMLRLSDWEGTLNPVNQRYPLPFLQQLLPVNFYKHKEWVAADSISVGSFSAVGYYFGRDLQKTLHIPIGLIGNAIGGVPIEAYLPKESLAADSMLHPLAGDHWIDNPLYPTWTAERVMQNLVSWKETGSIMPMPAHPYQPGFLFEAAIKPLQHLAFKGVIWYQGESNATYTADSAAMPAAMNKQKLSLLIKSWRDFFKDSTLPFVIIQLPSIQRDWELYREVQQQVSEEMKHVSLVITTDLGHATDVHPRNKKAVGERAARTTLHDVYHLPVPKSPALVSYQTEGNYFLLRFSDADNGLSTSDGLAVKRIFICGEDRVFYPAKVQFLKTGLKVSSEKVVSPVAVRYAFEDNPYDANLVNTAGMPVAPFRTDHW